MSSQTPNPQAVGEEKLYMTQVYQTESLNTYPFSDPSYFLINHEINDEFFYNQNDSSSENNDIDVTNIDSVYTYQPSNYRCNIQNNKAADGNEAIGVLTYRGTSITGDNGDSLTIAGSSAKQKTISITPNT